MPDPDGINPQRSPDTQMQVAAAAITAAISPPLGLAVAAGSALRSPRVRGALRKGAVQALAGAMQMSDELSAAAERRRANGSQPEAFSEAASNGRANPITPGSAVTPER